jgi:hypothetical protein
VHSSHRNLRNLGVATLTGIRPTKVGPDQVTTLTGGCKWWRMPKSPFPSVRVWVDGRGFDNPAFLVSDDTLS